MIFRFTIGVSISYFLVVSGALGQIKDTVQIDHATATPMFSVLFLPDRLREASSDEDDVRSFEELFGRVWGLDASKLDQVYLQFDFALGEQPYGRLPMFTLMFRSLDEIDDRNVVNAKPLKMMELRQSTYADKELWVSNDEDGPSLFFPDSRTVVLSFEVGNQALIDTVTHASTPEPLLSVSDYYEIAGVLNFEDHSDHVQNVLESFFNWAEFSTDEFYDAALLVKQGNFRFDFKSNRCIEARLETASEENALRVSEQIERAIKEFHVITNQLVEADDELDPFGSNGKAMANALFLIFDNVQVTTVGNDVQFIVERNGGIPELLDALRELMREFCEDLDELLD